MPRSRLVVYFFVAFALMLPLCGAFAQDCAGPFRVCELANSDDEIFTARVLSKMDENGNIRVQVLHLYRGTASGKISIAVSPFYQRFREGDTYLFFTVRNATDSHAPRISEQCITEPASLVPPDELAFLKGLALGPHTGSISGALSTSENLAYMNRLTGITIHFNSRLKSYSVITDEGGEFEIPKVQAGVYRVSVELPETLRMSEDEDIAVYPHGCMSADLLAVNNSSISGQITLPPGVKVEGTPVTALNLSGYSDGIAKADSQGHYEIVGVGPGEYVVGIIKNTAPQIGAPYATTYFPGAPNPEEAKRVVVIGPNRFTDIDMRIPTALKIVNFTVKATFDDGNPAFGQFVGISYSGSGLGSGSKTNGEGIASLSALRGEEFYVMGYPIRDYNQGKLEMRCLSPVKLGPANYPETLHVVYSKNGCTDQSNVEAAGNLRSQLHAKSKEVRIAEVRIAVSFPDGGPAENASVDISGKSDEYNFGSGFHTDKHGELTLHVPENTEFQVSASFLQSPITQCTSQPLTFKTEDGSWKSLAASKEPIRIVLSGPQCKASSR